MFDHIGNVPSELAGRMSLATDAARRDALFRLLPEEGVPLKGTVTTVKERGFKARVVSKSQGAAIELGHCLRKFLLEGLKKDKHVSSSLRGNHREAMENIFRRPRRGLVLSADLTAATDLLPLDLVSAIVDGLLSAKGNSRAQHLIPPSFARVLRLLTGP
jgi:hypothetical protein